MLLGKSGALLIRNTGWLTPELLLLQSLDVWLAFDGKGFFRSAIA